MSDIQQSRILGALYYDDSAPAYVAPPVKQMKDLMATKENDYLVTRANINELEKIKKGLPKDYSPDLYNNVVNNLNKGLSSITPDNMENHVLDVDQMAHDLVNKWGGQELIDEYQQIQGVQKYFKDALDKGDIKDPKMADWYVNNSLANRKPLKINPDGTIDRPNVGPVKYAKHVDIVKRYDDLVKGWAADKSISRNDNGIYTINRTIPGYLGLTENKTVSEQEILGAVMKVMKSDQEVAPYLNDKAAFDARNTPPTAENVNALLSPNAKKQIFGKDNVTIDDIQNAINSGIINPNQIVRDAYKVNDMLNVAAFNASKYGFNEETLTTLKDELLIEEIKASRAASTAKVDPAETAIVTIQPFMAQQELNPTDIKNLKTAKASLVEQRVQAQASLNNYFKDIEAGKAGADSEEFIRKQREVEALDEQIEEISNQERQLGKIMLDAASKEGININAEYNKYYNRGVEETKKLNTTLLKNSDFTLDVTSKVINRDGKYYIKLDNGIEQSVDSYKSITKVGNKFIYTKDSTQSNSTASTKGNRDFSAGNLWQNLQSVLFNERGEVTNNIGKLNKADTYSLATKEDYQKMLVSLFNNNEDSTNMIGMDKSHYTEDNKVIPGELIKPIERIREKNSDFKWSVTTPLEYLLVTGATTKSNLLNYTNHEKALNDTFRGNPGKGIPRGAEQYSIKTPEGAMQLGDYIKEELGLPDISGDYINWAQSSIVTLTDTDRKYGQKYGITLTLTPKGKEEVDSETFSKSPSIKLVGVNTTKNVKEEQDRIQSMLLNTYKDIQDNNTAYDLDTAKHMGKVYFNNTPEGQEFGRLNLYTLPAGESKNINIRGTDYKIFSTIKDADKSDLMNVNFHLSKEANGTEMVMARDVKTGKVSWMPLANVNKSNDFAKVVFETPDDIKANIGATLMDADFRQQKQANAAMGQGNTYMSTYSSSSYRTTSDGIIATQYKREVSSVQNLYNNPETIKLTNNVTGKVATIQSRVPATDLYDLSTEFSYKIAENTQYPYVNKNVVPFVRALLTNENVTVTGGYRGETTHSGLADSSEDSLHKYGYSLDLRKDKAGIDFYNKIKNNPELAAQYGIINIKDHGTTPHIHIEFKTNIL